jgi:diguanylate cyclase (GGDEF)-like protein
MLTALLAGDGADAERVALAALDNGLSAVELHALVVTPAMQDVGRLWEMARISSADEHLATATCHRVLAAVYPLLLQAQPRSRERIVLAALEPEEHAVAVRIVADVLEGAGFDVQLLGAGLPARSLVDAVDRLAPAAVGLSATMAHFPLAPAVAELARVHPGLPVVIGGSAAARQAASAPGTTVVGSLLDAVDAFAWAIAQSSRGSRRPEDSDHPRPGRPADDSRDAKLAEVSAGIADVARAHARERHGLQLAALRDPLTSLWNRRAFDERLLEAADDLSSTLLIVDVDGFKQVNDADGHPAGDRLLRIIALTLSAGLRDGDFCARIGGDEFAVVLARTSPAASRAVAERLRGAVAAATGGSCTVSIGVCAIGSDPRAALHAADAALYAAKRAGRDSVAAG